MKVLIVGAGMYVTGRGTPGMGTILPSLFQASERLPISGITIAAQSADNAAVVEQTARRIQDALKRSVPVRYETVASPAELGRLAAGHDCSIVAVPDHVHHACCEPLLRAGLHTLVVKPFTPTLGEARALLDLQRASGVHGAVEFHKRFDESNLYVKRVIESGQLGQPLYVSVEYSQRIDVPTKLFRAWADKTNVFQYIGVHYVDVIYFLTGWLPVRVTATGTLGTLAQRGIDTFDSVHATVVWRDPATPSRELVSMFSTCWVDPNETTAFSDQRYLVVGTEGRIECDQKRRGIEAVFSGDGARSVNPYFSDFLPGPQGGLVFDGYGHRSIVSFLDDVIALGRGQTTPEQLERSRPSFAQAIVSTAVVDAANRSLRHQSQWQEIDVEAPA